MNFLGKYWCIVHVFVYIQVYFLSRDVKPMGKPNIMGKDVLDKDLKQRFPWIFVLHHSCLAARLVLFATFLYMEVGGACGCTRNSCWLNCTLFCVKAAAGLVYQVCVGCVMLLEVVIVGMRFCVVKMSASSSCIICCLSMLLTITASPRHSQQRVSSIWAALSVFFTMWNWLL